MFFLQLRPEDMSKRERERVEEFLGSYGFWRQMEAASEGQLTPRKLTIAETDSKDKDLGHSGTNQLI